MNCKHCNSDNTQYQDGLTAMDEPPGDPYLECLDCGETTEYDEGEIRLRDFEQ